MTTVRMGTVTEWYQYPGRIMGQMFARLYTDDSWREAREMFAMVLDYDAATQGNPVGMRLRVTVELLPAQEEEPWIKRIVST